LAGDFGVAFAAADTAFPDAFIPSILRLKFPHLFAAALALIPIYL
jgi:hypothetical protein